MKKGFIDKLEGQKNPALAFISTGNTQQTEPAPAQTAAPIKRNPLFVETKSRRLQVLMQPSLHARLKKLAYEKGISFNELLHSTLETYADEEEKRGL